MAELWKIMLWTEKDRQKRSFLYIKNFNAFCETSHEADMYPQICLS